MVIILSVRNLEHYLTRTRHFQINRDSKRLKMNQTAQMGGGGVAVTGMVIVPKLVTTCNPVKYFTEMFFCVIYILRF